MAINLQIFQLSPEQLISPRKIICIFRVIVAFLLTWFNQYFVTANIKKEICQKKRKYSEDYVKFGFTCCVRDKIEKPQCFLCSKILCNDNIRLSKKSCGISASLSLQARSSSCIRRIGSRQSFLESSFQALTRV